VSSCITSVGIAEPSWSRCTEAGPVGSMRWADQPQAPASMAWWSRRLISACCSGVGSLPALAASKPITQIRSGEIGI